MAARRVSRFTVMRRRLAEENEIWFAEVVTVKKFSVSFLHKMRLTDMSVVLVKIGNSR